MAVALTNTMPQAYQEQIYRMTSEQKIDLVEFILQSMRTTDKAVEEPMELRIHNLDDKLYGSIHLPADFDYDTELHAAMNQRYGL